MKRLLLVIVAAVLVPGLIGASEPPPKVPGVILNHSPANTRRYIGSPGLAILPDGTYVASHDYFGPGAGKPPDRTLVFTSSDKGRTWAQQAEIVGQWWSSLFVHKGALYLMGVNRENGFAAIRRSLDGGKIWTAPEDPSTGLLFADGTYHCAPVPVVTHKGRLWRAMEDTTAARTWAGKFRAFMMSAPVDADLLQASSWTASERLGREPYWLEGNAVVAPDENMVDILRVDLPAGVEEKAAIVHISADGKNSSFDPDVDYVPFPGGAKKFTIRFDPASKRYWALVNAIPPRHRGPKPASVRNTLALSSSPDLKHWTVHSVLLYHPEVKHHGFQYADWLFDGNDLIALVRTAYDDGQGGAHNAHDANYLTFHRWPNFRNRTMKDSEYGPPDLFP